MYHATKQKKNKKKKTVKNVLGIVDSDTVGPTCVSGLSFFLWS
jgi:hypothetical protein